MKILRFLRRETVQIVLLALPLILAAAFWNRIPPVITSHWGLSGQPDGWMPKLPGLLIAPTLNVGMAVLLAWLPRLDPRLRRDATAETARFRRLMRWCRWLVTGNLSLAGTVIVATAAGWSMDVGRVMCDGALLLFAALGNVFGNLPSNYLIGVRTPWTLEDPATWRATHRLAGRVMVFGALGVLGVGFFVPTGVLTGLLIAFIVALGIGSLGCSAWFYRRNHA